MRAGGSHAKNSHSFRKIGLAAVAIIGVNQTISPVTEAVRPAAPCPRPNQPMSDAHNHKNGNWHLPRPAGTLPDFAVCRARRKKEGGLVHCLVANAYHCPHATRADYSLICCHPEKEAIIARTKAGQGG